MKLENPIAQLQNVKKRAVGFSFNLLQRINFLNKGLGAKSHRESDEIVAVDLGQTHTLVLGLEKKKERPLITHFRLENRPPATEDLSDQLRQIFKEENLPTKKIRVALKGQGVVIRILTFPQMKKEEFASAIRYEIEKYIPFKATEVILDFQILREHLPRGDHQVMEVLLVAVKQSEVYQLMRILQGADLEASLIDVASFAVANFVEYARSEATDKTVAFLDIGTDTTSLGVLIRRRPVFIREISFGGADIIKLLKRKLGLQEEALATLFKEGGLQDEQYRTIIDQGIESFLTEMKLTMNYYSNHVAGAESIQTLMILGGGSRFFSDLQLFEKELGIKAERPQALSRIGYQSGLKEEALKKNEDLLPVALGLCLRP